MGTQPFPVDHDLHCHSSLSLCSADKGKTAKSILDFALNNNYRRIAVTDHFWDEAVPGASDWYAQQGLEHIRQILPLPSDDSVEFLFGCEYAGNKEP